MAAVSGMLAGFGITVYYMLANWQALRSALGSGTDSALWFGIQPIAGGVFGVALGTVVTVAVTLATSARAR